MRIVAEKLWLIQQTFLSVMSGADDDGKYFKELIPLVASVNARPETFATGDYGVRDSALLAEKFVFDHGTNPRTRSQC